jgi:SPP1 family predicted phage head-tail adaptor
MDFALARKRAKFQSLATTSDGGGGFSSVWVDYATVWAQFSPDRAREKIQQGRIADNQSGVLRIRSSTTSRAINDIYRVVLDGVIYNVKSNSNPDQRNDVIELIIETDGSQFVAAGTNTFTPSLDFRDARNSQYLAALVVGMIHAASSLDFTKPPNSGQLAALGV